MKVGEKGLRERANKIELKALQKIRFTPCIFIFDELLHDVCIARNPRPEDYHNRKDLVRVFNVMAKDIYGNNGNFPIVEAFGSFSMNMFSAKSDLDLSINFENSAADFPREKKISALRKFANFLYNLQWKGHVYGVHPIMGAKVPIVKVVDRGTGIECDISVENKDGIAKSQIIHIISAIDERFQKLSFLMKAWASANDINSSKDGTLNSLSLILLAAFHLQTRDPPILPPFSRLFKEGTDPANLMKTVSKFIGYGRRNKESLAELFITLISKLQSDEDFWSEGLCASTYEGAWIFKKWGSRFGNISVEDFTDRSQNVARAVGEEEVKEIYKCINNSLADMLAFMDGRIEATNLRALLFGSEHDPYLEKYDMMNHKRSFPPTDHEPPSPLHPVPAKRVRYMDDWDPWIETSHMHHRSSNHVLPPPRLDHGSQPPPFVPPPRGPLEFPHMGLGPSNR